MYIMEEYDDALKKILIKGIKKSSRAGDTYSIFGMQARYKIDTHFPILTKRKMFYKSIFAELLWMLSGSTNVNDLEALGSKIWSPWKDKAFEEKNKYNDADLGPIYGFQLRHFGGNYDERNTLHWPADNHSDAYFCNKQQKRKIGFDQIEYMMNELKTNKHSRRILFNLWDPKIMTSNKVKLPVCHYSFQLSVDDNDRLSGMLTQRSADYPVGVPANIQFYSALIYMFAQQAGLEPYELIHSTADSHIYQNQIEAVEEYLNKPEINSPNLILEKANSIDEYKLDSFKIKNYNPSSVIKMAISI